MKKIILQIMAVLMIAVMLMPFAGNAATAYAEETHKGSVTFTASGGWVEKEVSINELLGSVAPEDVKAIKFTGDVAFSAGYNTVDHIWEWSSAAKSYTAKNIALDGWYAFKFALTANDGKEHTINWEVLTEEGGDSQDSTEVPAVSAADYTGDYTLGYKFASSDFAKFDGEVRLTFDFVRTGEHDYYQFTMIKNIEGWPKLTTKDYTELSTPINDWGFIELTDDSVSTVSMVLSEKLVKELAGGVELGIQVYGIVIAGVELTAIPKATPTPTPSPTPTPTPVPKLEDERKNVGGELVITEDMAFSNGVVLVQNAEYDSIVLNKETEVKAVQLKNVGVASVQIESGAEYTVRVYDSDIKELNVNAPQIEGISLNTLLKMLEEDSTVTEEVMADYEAYCAALKQVENKKVSVVVEGYSTVEAVTIAASANVDFSGIRVEEKNTEEAGDLTLFSETVEVLPNMTISCGLDNVESMKVFVNGYHGNVHAKLPAEKNAYTYYFLTFNNSEVEHFAFEGTDGSFYLSGSDSSVKMATLDNVNAVTLGFATESVVVSEATKGADISIYDKVDNIVVDGEKNDVILAMAAKVKNAEVSGDNIRIYGYGLLEAANITGKGANVAARGAAVSGENNASIPSEMQAMSPVRVSNTSTNHKKPEGSEGEVKPSGPIYTFTDGGPTSYSFLITDYLPDYQDGEQVKVKVQLTSNSWYGGGLGGNDKNTVNDDGTNWLSSQFSNADGDYTTWAAETEISLVELYGGAGELMVQIWWWGEVPASQEIHLNSITVERVTAGEEPETEPEPAYVGTAVYNDETDWWGQYNVDAATILGGVDAENVAYVEFSCDVNLVIQYNQVGNDDGAIQTSSATWHTLTDINFPGFYMDIILNGGTGEDKTVTWKVYTN